METEPSEAMPITPAEGTLSSWPVCSTSEVETEPVAMPGIAVCGAAGLVVVHEVAEQGGLHVSPAARSLAGAVAPEAMPPKDEDSPGSWGASQTCFAELAFRLMLRSAETSLGVNW